MGSRYPAILEGFISGNDRSMESLTSIEAELDEAFPNDEKVHDFVVDIARYRPGGGQFLHDEEEMLARVRWIKRYLGSLRSEKNDLHE
jgi:hypothetical protein